jgi:hypothetical protein
MSSKYFVPETKYDSDESLVPKLNFSFWTKETKHAQIRLAIHSVN